MNRPGTLLAMVALACALGTIGCAGMEEGSLPGTLADVGKSGPDGVPSSALPEPKEAPSDTTYATGAFTSSPEAMDGRLSRVGPWGAAQSPSLRVPSGGKGADDLLTEDLYAPDPWDLEEAGVGGR